MGTQRLFVSNDNILRAATRVCHGSRVEKFSTGLTSIARMSARTILALFFILTLTTSSFAQENRILMTSEQQYQNMVPNSSFESWDATNVKPTDWTKIDTPTLAQDASVKRIGANALKITSSAGTTSQGVSYAVTVEPKTTYTFSCYYYSAALNQAELAVVGNVTANLVADTVLASTSGVAWKRYSITFTTVTDTSATIKLYAKADAGGAKSAYFDAVALSEGNSTPAFTAHAITDTGNHTMYGGLTVNGTTNLNGDVNLGDLSTDNITLNGTLKGPSDIDIAITPQGTGKVLLTGDITITGALNIAEGAIQDAKIVTADLKDGAVTSAKIATDTITAGNIAAGAVTTNEILDGTIANGDLASGSFANITGVGTLGSLTVSGATNLATTTGSVGIGTTNPSAGLDVQKAVTAASGAARGVNLSQTLTAAANNDIMTGLRIAPTFTNGAYTGVKNYGLIVESGNVGIGTTTPASALDVSGTITSTGLTVSSGTVSLPSGQIDNAELANSSITVTAGTGLVTGGAVSLGGTVTVDLGTLTGLTAGADTLAVNYGSTANTAAQGNVTLTGPSAGNGLTGGGGTIAVGAGGTFSAINIGSDSTISVGADAIGINLGNANTWTAGQTFNASTNFPGSGIWNTSGNIGIGTTGPASKLHGVATLNAATGNEIAYQLNYTTNKATSGNDTGLLIAMTDTLSPGTSLPLDIQVGGASKFYVDNAGNLTTLGTINGQTIGDTTSLAAVNVSGDMTVGGGYGVTGITMDSTGNLKLDGNIYIKGVMYRENLTDLQVQNNTITLNASDAPSDTDAYIGVMSGGTKLAPTYTGQIKWTAATDTWDISNDFSLATGKAYKINNTSVLSATALGSSVVSSSLTSVGVISTGTWNATAIAVDHGGTGLTSYTVGDIVYASGAATLNKLADVATGSVLVSGGVGTAPSYSSSPTISGALTVQGSGDSSFVGKVGIGTTAPGSPLQVNYTNTATSGTISGLQITPTYNQASGTAANTDLLINRTQTAVGSGSQYLIDAQVGGVSKAKIDSTGAMTIQGLTIGSTALTSSTSGSEGATLVGAKTSYTNISNPAAANVQAVLNAIDSTLGAISGGTGSFTNLTVTGTSDLRGNISNTTGAVTIADALTQTGSGNQVSFAGNVDAANGLDVSGAALTSSAGLTVSASGASITGGLNNNTGGITNAGAISGATTVTASGAIVTSSTIRSLSSVGMIPEYDNATPRPDSTDNFGTLSVQYANSHNYYEWTTNEPTTQDYDIVIRYRLPDGFSSFDATAPIILWNKVSVTPGSTKVDVTMLDTAGSSVTLTGGATLQNTSWTETTITADTSGKTFTPGGYITITIKMSADQGKTADVGELTLKGNW